MNNISVVDSEKCYGCTSCVTLCHFSAIEMQENEKGFLNPVIDTGKCVNCGKCVKACPAIKLPNIDEYEQSFYAMKANDDSIRQKSTSGGAFSVLASCLAEKNAIVYGSVFERTGVKHIRVDDGDLELLRGSKYVPSNLNDTFLKIIEDLKSNKTVMFVGTPCQCGGLKKCISNTAVSSQNLYIIDFICQSERDIIYGMNSAYFSNPSSAIALARAIASLLPVFSEIFKYNSPIPISEKFS